MALNDLFERIKNATTRTTTNVDNNTSGTANDGMNLSGVNNISSSRGTPKSAPAPVASTDFNLAGTNNIRNAVGTPAKQQQGKTFIDSGVNDNYNVNSKVTQLQVKDNLQRNDVQTALNKVADESNRAVGQALNTINDTVIEPIKNIYREISDAGKANQEYQNQLRESRFEKGRQEDYEEYDARSAELLANITDEDRSKFYNLDGTQVNYDSQIKELNSRKASLQNIIDNSENELDVNRASAEEELKEVTKQLDSLNLLKEKRDVFEEDYNLKSLLESGDERAYKDYRELVSHRYDNMLERAGSATSHLLTQTINEIPTLVDQASYALKANIASQGIDELKDAYERKEITTDQYVKALADIDDKIKRAQEEYGDSISQEIRKVVNNYGANTYYGANDVEKFILQAGESTAQFMLHYVISSGIASVAFKEQAIIEAGRNFVVEQFGKEALENIGTDALIKYGTNVLGGSIATVSMSGVSATEKTNQLLDEGVDIQTAYMNGVFTGLVSYATEKIGMDRFVEMLGTPVSSAIMGEMVVKHFRNAMSEGFEEVVEGLVDPLIDSVTLGKDYEVNGSELLMSFMLGGTSGLLMSVGGSVGNVIQSIPTSIKVGKLVVANKQQRSMVINEINTLTNNLESMTPKQQEVARQEITRGSDAINEYDSKSTMLGVTFSSDNVEPISQEESDKAVVEALTPNFNQEVQMINSLDNLKNQVDKDIDQVIDTELSVLARTQDVLNNSGYNIDAEVFNSLDSKAQNDALVALDFAKTMGLNVYVVNDASLRNMLMERGFTGSELERRVKGTNGFVTDDGQIVINGSKRPILFTLTHELTHGTESSQYYPILKGLVKGMYDTGKILDNDNNVLSWDDAFAERADTYKGIEDSPENIEKELVARTVEKYLGDEEFLDDLIKYNFSLASRIYQNIRMFGENPETLQIRNAFEKAFADTFERQTLNNPAYRVSPESQNVIQRIAPRAFTDGGKILNIYTQTTNLRNNPVETGNVVVPTNKSLMFAGIDNILFFDSEDLTHIDQDNHNMDDALLTDLLQNIEDYAVLGLNYRAKNGKINKNVILEKDGTYYILSVYKKNARGYNINGIKTLYEYNNYNQENPNDISGFILNNLQFQKKYNDKKKIDAPIVYYVNEKSNDFLSRLGLSSEEAVLNSIATDLRVDQEDKSVKWSYDDLRKDGSRKDLRAVHNLSEDKLIQALDLGGLVMPSVAITNEDISHDGFGEISIVMDSKSIDPSKRDNIVYKRDAWTPTFPHINYDVSYDSLSDVYNNLSQIPYFNELTKESTNMRRLSDRENFADLLENHRGNPVEAFKDNKFMKTLYLINKGDIESLPMKESKILNSFENEDAKELINVFGPEEIQRIWQMDSQDVIAMKEDIRKKLNDYFEQKYDFPNLYAEEDFGFAKIDEIMYGLSRYINDPSSFQEIDSSYFDNMVKDINQEDYINWLNDVFGNLEISKGIRNNKDWFDRAGNRRKFNQTHDEVTANSVLRNMKQQTPSGTSGWGSGYSSVLGAYLGDFDSLQEIIDSENLLSSEKSDEFNQLEERWEDIRSDVASQYGNNIESSLRGYDNFQEASSEFARSRNRSEENLKRIFKEYGFDLSDTQVQEFMDVLESGRNVTTDYFEAKPQRVVGPEEWKQVYVPNTANPELIQRLKDMGVEVIEYNKSVEGDRQNKMKYAQRYQFSFDSSDDMSSIDNDGYAIPEKMRELMKGTKLTDSYGQLMRIYHTSPNLFTEFDPRDSDFYRFGDKVVNYYSTNYDVSGSYTDGVFEQMQSAEDIQNVENKKVRYEEIRKEITSLAHARWQYQEDYENDLYDTLSKENISDALQKTLQNIANFAIPTNKELFEGVGGFQNYDYVQFVSNIIRRAQRGVDSSSVVEIINMLDDGKYNERTVSKEIRDLFKPLNKKAVKEELYKIINERENFLKTVAKYDEQIEELKKEQSELSGPHLGGLQYVGYGKTINPYVLENNGDANWNTINSTDFRMSVAEYNGIAREVARIFDMVRTYEQFSELGKTKNRINRAILENADEDVKNWFIKNPIALANCTNIVRSSIIENKTTYDVVQDIMFRFNNSYNPNMENFNTKLETNDVVTAVLAVNDYTDSPYDGVIFKNITDSASNEMADVPSDIVALFNSNQFKLVENENPTTSPDIRFSLDDKTAKEESTDTQESVQNQYFDYGMNPVRNVDILRQTEAGPTSRYWNNLANSQYVSEEEAQRIKTMVEKGLGAYETTSREKQEAQAKKLLKNMGMEDTFKYIMNADSVATIDVDNTLGRLLQSEMRQKGLEDTESFRELSARMQWRSTMQGKGLESFKGYRDSTPEGQIVTIRSEIERIQQGLNERYGDRANNIELNEDLIAQYLRARNDTERETIKEQIARDVAKQIPPSALEQLNSFRHLSMLFNPRTWIKNSLANRMFGYINEGTRVVRSVMESTLNIEGLEREAGIYNPFSSKDKALYKRFKTEYGTEFKNIDMKYSQIDAGNILLGTEFGEEVSRYRDQFTSKFLNKLSEINAKMMSDAPGMSTAYAKSMVGYLKANGLDINTISEEQLQKAKDFAINEAKYATFNSYNKLASDIAKFSNDGSMARRIVVESFLPFKRTPLNLLRTGFRYTPVGLADSMTRQFAQLKSGKITANVWINNVAQGMTGSAIMLLGMLLSNMGIFRTKDDDPDRKQYLDQELGEQEYSLNWDGGSYTIDWVDPMIVPLAMGAELMKYVQKGEYTLDDAVNMVAGLADPMFETSMLSGISKNLSSYSQGTTQWWGKIAQNAVTNYVSQYIPSILGATARTVDDTRRSTYTDKGAIDRFIRTTRNKIPGLSQFNEPYINRSGEEEKNETLGMGAIGRAVLNFLSPGYYSSKKDYDNYDAEMYRLYDETGEIDSLPSNASKNLTFDGENYKFSPQQYTQWQRTRWQTEAEYVNQFMDSQAYKNLDDAERVATIKDIRSYAQKVAKKQFLESQGIEYNDDKQLNNAQGAMDNGIELYAYFDYLNNSGSKQAEKMAYLEKSGFSQKQKEYLWELSGYKKSYADVYASVFGETSNKSSKTKKSSKSSKKSSSNKVSVSGAGGASSASVGSSGASSIRGGTGRANMVSAPSNAVSPSESEFVNKYLSAYSSSINRRKDVSTGNASVVCPNCGSRVTPYNGRCPVCGNPL